MARPTNESIFLRKVREAGGSIGNGPLKRGLGWSDDKYWEMHTQLVNDGLIVKGRGNGGSVILVVPDSIEEAKQTATALPKKQAAAVEEILVEATNEASRQPGIRELDLYDPALDQLIKYWSQQEQLLNGVYQITALQGRRETGGSWTRPDIVAVGLRKFEYLPDKLVEVYSFELKAENDISIKGVLEALAHREFATRSYVIYHTGGQNWDDFAEAQRIEQLAARHGVGVIVASDISNFNESWDKRVTATRSNSDPEVLDRFLKQTLTEEAKSQIRKW